MYIVVAPLQSWWTRERTGRGRVKPHLLLLLIRVFVIGAGWGIFIPTYLQVTAMRNWMHNSGWFGKKSENVWEFGQLVPCFLMGSVALVLAQAIVGMTSFQFLSGWKPPGTDECSRKGPRPIQKGGDGYRNAVRALYSDRYAIVKTIHNGGGGGVEAVDRCLARAIMERGSNLRQRL